MRQVRHGLAFHALAGWDARFDGYLTDLTLPKEEDVGFLGVEYKPASGWFVRKLKAGGYIADHWIDSKDAELVADTLPELYHRIDSYTGPLEPYEEPWKTNK